MAHGFKESDFQHGVFIPYLTAPLPAGLNWILGKPADIDQARWLVPADLLQFLREGCPLNAAAFAKAIKAYDSDAEFLQAFLNEALLPKIEAKANAAFVLRESLSFAGQSFVLWNEAPRAGAASSAADLFQKNLLRVIPEATFERKFVHGNKRIRRRPDLVFFVNGLYLAYAELKTAQTGQTAAGHGRKKIAHDCVEAGAAALREARERYAAQGAPWPGFRHRDLSEKLRWELRQTICLYEKATHISCIDMGEMMLLADIDWLLPEIDDALAANDTQALVETLPDKLVASFLRTADMRERPAFAALAQHLASFFDPADGIDREIHFFNQNRPSRTTTGTEVLRPRPAQRTMLHQTLCRVRELYAAEGKAKINEADIRAALALSLPALDPKKADDIVNKTLLHRNGQESHSILLQGAAGLGKTNVIVWLAQALADMPDPRSAAAAPLFDLCILLTDRTELRQNVADEAARLRATQSIVAEAETFKDLRDGLQNGVRVVVVNIQKFPSIQRLAVVDPVLSKMLANSRQAGERVMALLRKLYAGLKLQINEAKSAVASAFGRKFLGYALWVAKGKEVKCKVAEKPLSNFKARIRQLTRRCGVRSMEQVVQKLRPYVLGWKAYFGLAQTPRVWLGLDEWLRHRLRAIQIKQWKRPKTMYRELMALGATQAVARQVAGNCHCWWRNSDRLLKTVITIAYFDRMGVPRLS